MRRAEQLGLDIPRFTECLQSGETAELIQRDVAEGKRLAVNATPAFFVGVVGPDRWIDLRKRINGAVGLEDFEKAIREVRPANRAGAWFDPPFGFTRATP